MSFPKVPKLRQNATGPSYTIECPTCGAPPGSRCCNSAGVESDEPHARRVVKANANKGETT